MRNCSFKRGRCVACGAARVNERQICRSMTPGLGDRVAAVLSAAGITSGAVSAFLGVDDCGCAARQKWLNEAGRRLGIGVDASGGDTPSRQT